VAKAVACQGLTAWNVAFVAAQLFIVVALSRCAVLCERTLSCVLPTALAWLAKAMAATS
jgi:hypothetical protein